MKKLIIYLILTSSFLLSCEFNPPFFNNLQLVPNIKLEEAWNIQIADENSHSTSYIFNENRIFLYVNDSLSKDNILYTIDLDTHKIINQASIPDVNNIAFCGNNLFVSRKSIIQPALYTVDINGNLKEIIPIDNEFNFNNSIYSHNNRLYWWAKKNNKSSLVRFDPTTVPQIKKIFSGNYNFFFCSEPRFYDGIGYFTAEPFYNSNYKNTRLVSFDEASTIIISERDLDKDLYTHNNGGIILKSGDSMIINDSYINPATGSITQNIYEIQTKSHNMLITDLGFYGYSDIEDPVKEKYSAVWKLEKNHLDRIWQTNIPLDIYAQMQINNEILYIPAKDQVILINTNNGDILAKDTSQTTGPNTYANTGIYNNELIYFDGSHVRALKTNWKINFFGWIIKDE